MAVVEATHDFISEGGVWLVGYELYPGILLRSDGGAIPAWRWPTRPAANPIRFAVDGATLASGLSLAGAARADFRDELGEYREYQVVIPDHLPPRTLDERGRALATFPPSNPEMADFLTRSAWESRTKPQRPSPESNRRP